MLNVGNYLDNYLIIATSPGKLGGNGGDNFPDAIRALSEPSEWFPLIGRDLLRYSLNWLWQMA